MILRLLSPQPRSMKWTEKENLGINASPNLPAIILYYIIYIVINVFS